MKTKLNKLNLIYSTLFLLSGALSAQVNFGDTFFQRQWGIKNSGQVIQRATGETTREDIIGTRGVDINFYPVTQQTSLNKEIVVAVIDSGVDIHHPDLAGRIWKSNECRPSSKSDVTFPCNGFDILDSEKSVQDNIGHGTHVAGIIAANTNNIGISGITPSNVKIMPVKILNTKLGEEKEDYVYKRRIVTEYFADGISFARRHGAHIINLSLGWPQLVHTPRMVRELALAEKAGILIIAAAGNNNKNVPVFPCAYKGVLCVGAVDNQGKITSFTNYGGKVDLLAPGESIISTYPMNLESSKLRITGYELKKGSSQAAPYVAGIAAVVKLLNPDMSIYELKARLLNSARPVQLSNHKNKNSKYGLVDMRKAVTEKPFQFVTPNFKDILDVEYKSESGAFNIALPIDSFVGEANNIKVRISFDDPNIALEKSEGQISRLPEGAQRNVVLSGRILDLTKKSQVNMSVQITTGEGFSQTTSTMISFVRKVQAHDVREFPITDLKSSLVVAFRERAKLSIMKKIEDPFNLAGVPEYYFVSSKKQKEDRTVVTFLKKDFNTYKTQDLEIPKVRQVLKVYRADINRDGSDDYLIYSRGEKSGNLVFSYYDSNLNPLFGSLTHWNLPITRFFGL